MFIVLEGVDGCGKSTQAKLLYNWLGKNYNVILTKEPTENKIGKFIREILSGGISVDPKTLALLFTADRYEHLENEVIPALNNNKIIVCERYYFSTIAYQMAQGIDRKWLENLNKFALKPDLALFIDVPPETAVKRTETGEIFETHEFSKKIYKNYLLFDLIRIDGNRDVEMVFENIKAVVKERLVL